MNELVYEGSVKRLWRRAPGRLSFEFTDHYSVFDWGRMPDEIALKGRSLLVMGAWFFERLSQPENFQIPDSPRLDPAWLKARRRHPVHQSLARHGQPSHFLGLRAPEGPELELAAAARHPGPVTLEVLEAATSDPEERVVDGRALYFYPPPPSGPRVLPLEVVYRFGMPPGSSLKKRLEQDPGLRASLPPGDEQGWFAYPLLEFYTKLEPGDRLLSWQEAGELAALTADEFEHLVERTWGVALAMLGLTSTRGLELWDGKLEWILDRGRGGPEGPLLLADSIGPDEMRLLYPGASSQLSKEFLRQPYRGTPWEQALAESKRTGRPCPLQPEPLPPALKALADQLYPVLTNHLVERPLFANQPSLAELVARMEPSHAR